MAAAAGAFARTASGDMEVAGGVVRITASNVIGVHVLLPILKALRDEHPRLVLELHLADHAEDLLTQQADIAVRMVPPKQAAGCAYS